MTTIVATVRRIINIQPMIGVEVQFKINNGRRVYDVCLLEEGKNKVKANSQLIDLGAKVRIPESSERPEVYGDECTQMYISSNRITVRGTDLDRAVSLFNCTFSDGETPKFTTIRNILINRFKSVMSEFQDYTRDFLRTGTVPGSVRHYDELHITDGYARLLPGRGFKFVRNIHRYLRDREVDVITVKGLDGSGFRFSVIQMRGTTYDYYDDHPGIKVMQKLIEAIKYLNRKDKPEQVIHVLGEEDKFANALLRETTYAFKMLGIEDKPYMGINCDQNLGHSKTFWDMEDPSVTKELVNALDVVVNSEILITTY